MGQINNYPIIVDIEDSTFVVETSAGTHRLTFNQIAEYFQKIVDEGGIGEAKNTAASAANAAIEAINVANDAKDAINDVIQKNVQNAYIRDRHLFIVLTDETTIDVGVVVADVPQYGVCIDHNTGSKTLVRVNNSSGMIAEYGVGDKKAYNDFDAKEIWQLMRRCTLADDGTVTSYKGDANYVEDGSIGQVMVEYQKFYCKREFDESHNKEYLWFCTEKLDGYFVPPFFTDKDGNEVETFYLGAFEMTKSESGAGQSVANVEREKFKYFDLSTMAQSRGSNWHNIDYCEYAILIEMAFLIEFATTDSESVFSGAYSANNTGDYYPPIDTERALTNNFLTEDITILDENVFYKGQNVLIQFVVYDDETDFIPQNDDEVIDSGDIDGRTFKIYETMRKVKSVDVTAENCTIAFSGNAIYVDENAIMTSWSNMLTGEANIVVASSGVTTEVSIGSAPFVFRGLENPFSNGYTWINGIYMRQGKYYVSTDLSHYGEYSGYRCIPDDAIELEYDYPGLSGEKTGFISELGYDKNVPWAMMPTKTQATSDDGYCDKMTVATSINENYDYVFRFGGTAVSDGGLFSCYASVARTLTSCGRLAYRHFE